ncbi:uncharacterized protein LOC9301679 isoform X1 [Arabidopsis lyrata subsp. lyrata]|uniref:uncharacterized protein LOC9301679 isoform X1 n=1 Tax=Arabidopsis lyrata subsp. lyrata TaxID=81972 RepID=UPI000A29C7E2|nr:uncharacterized protein LOC9301679 isoform X1 [Arabidopsis lyrata subsp. lyrata]|eukprot:XP_020882702.1 uncharacterized protein LOC9301679 isoform X1 [Arabidopsis lyrata subsp. lyrata]
MVVDDQVCCQLANGSNGFSFLLDIFVGVWLVCLEWALVLLIRFASCILISTHMEVFLMKLKTHEDAITNIKNELAVVELKVQRNWSRSGINHSVGGCQYIMFPGRYIYTKRLKDAKRLKSSLRWVWPWEE